MKRQLLLGCGNSRDKRMGLAGDDAWGDLVTLDIDPETGCDVVHDMESLPYPFADDEFDECHAYETLEHQGRQGDWRFFFEQFSELHRILKPGGFLFISVPSIHGPWAWGDPGHTRVLPLQCFWFLSQDHYEQVGKTACTDYRRWWRGDFRLMTHDDDGLALRLVLQRVPHG